MGNNTLETILGGIGREEQVNQYKEALVGDILPRNLSGEVENGAANIGSAAVQFRDIHIDGFGFTQGGQGGFVPSGVILPYTCSSTIAPAGWIFADGKTIGNVGSGADHQGEQFRFLFEQYKTITAYGNTGTEDFDLGGKVKIPNPNGRFIRTIGANDPDGTRGIGSVQATAILSHDHGMTYKTISGYGTTLTYSKSPLGNTTDSGDSVSTNNIGNTYDILSSGGAESRPVNIAFPHIIKV